MKKLFTLLGILCLAGSQLIAQQPACGTTTPNGPILTAPSTLVVQQLQQVQNDRSVKVLPVVFHVLHSLYANQPYGTGANIPHQLLLDALTATNTYLRKQNADTNLTPAPFTGLSIDCDVELCLAQVDPNGNTMYEAGVDRISCLAEGIQPQDLFTLTQFQQNFTPQLVWDQTKYLNIWVAPVYMSGYGGWGMFPDSSGLAGLSASNGSGTGDGVYVYYPLLTTSPRLLSHEVGHFLGLRHIWGDAACGDDYCADTPTQQTSNSGCPSFPHITCTNGPDGDMFTNYMDYTADNCQHQFTPGQKARMQIVLLNSPRRRELPFSSVCTPGPGVLPVAAFAALDTLVCPGQNMHFLDCSGYQPTLWSWTFPGGTPGTSAQQNPVISYALPGTYSATLIVSNAQGSDTITLNNIVTVLGYGTYPSTENFESAQLPPAQFQLVTLPWTMPLPNWTIGNASAYGNGQHCMMHTPAWNLHPIRSYLLDLSSATQPQLTFDYAASHNPNMQGGAPDFLLVSVSTDCAQTFDTVLFIPDTLFLTAPPAVTYTPQPGHWRTVIAGLSAYAGMTNVYVQIQGSSHTETFCIDNINLQEPNPLAAPSSFLQSTSLHVFPNPSNGNASVTISGLNGRAGMLTLCDVTGRTLNAVPVTDGKTTPDFGMLAPGIYFLQLSENGNALSTVTWVVAD